MNGRVYDPALGRFISPDPYIQDGGLWLNYNRYAYCLNNPLAYTDPTGEFWHLVIGAAIGGVMNWAANDCEFTWKGLGYFGVGAVAGALSAGVGSGVSSALAGKAFSAGFIGSAAAGTATSGFISGVAIGSAAGFSGGFVTGLGNGLVTGDGFKSALISGSEMGFYGGVSGGLIGGTISGFDAVAHKRNFWTGKDQGSGRSLFAFNNSDKAHTHYRTKRGGYELIDNIERNGDQWVQNYTDWTKYGELRDGVSTGGISRRDNYLSIGDKDLNLSLNRFKGKAKVNFKGHILEGCSIEVSFDGNIVKTFSAGRHMQILRIPASVKRIGIRYIGVPQLDFMTRSPWRSTITGIVR